MNKDEFNINFNKLIFDVEGLEHKSVCELSEDITKVAMMMDDFKERCMRELYFKEGKK